MVNKVNCEWMGVTCPAKILNRCRVLPQVQKLNEEMARVKPRTKQYWLITDQLDGLASDWCDLEERIGHVIEDKVLLPTDLAKLR
ncbi:hypothetical protein HY440_01150 [Candidatus Microgenomates bacterium]|nr:hypothetical protein [Candidatus Microgenomates bacterium]